MYAPKMFKLFAAIAVAVAALGTTAVAQAGLGIPQGPAAHAAAQASVAYPPGPSGQGQIIAI